MSVHEPESDALLRLAQHLASEVIGHGRCELSALPGESSERDDEAWPEDRGRCKQTVVAIRWEGHFADSVCEKHAQNAVQRGAVVVRPHRHDGSPTTGLPSSRCAHDCDPSDPEIRRPEATHFLDCPVWSWLGVGAS